MKLTPKMLSSKSKPTNIKVSYNWKNQRAKINGVRFGTCSNTRSISDTYHSTSKVSDYSYDSIND